MTASPAAPVSIAGRLIAVIPVAMLCIGVATAQYPGWQIPPTAKDEKSPLKANADVLKKGKAIYDRECAKCHGKEGKGDGPDGDKDHLPADLTDSFRAPLNPDGVMYYKIANGHGNDMPAFKGKLSKDEIWQVVEYAKSLRVPEKP